MSIFDTIKEQASSAVKSTGELIEITRLNREVNQIEAVIEQKLASIGRLVLLAYDNGFDMDPELAEKCLAVKDSLKAVEELKVRIMNLKDKKPCTECQAELGIDDLFCRKCGAKQPEPQVEEPVEPDMEEEAAVQDGDITD